MNEFIILLLASCISAQTCVNEQQVTTCRDFELDPGTSLTSNTGILILKNISGSIYKKHLANLSKVSEITITDSAIDWIEEGALCSLPKLTSVNIYFNSKFQALTKEVLENCFNVKKIYIAGAVFHPNLSFANMPSLETITLNYDVFTDPLSKTTFSGLKSLRSLTIDQVALEGIESGTFDDLTSLKYLSLQYNEIESLPDGIFKNLRHLKVLNLSDNKLKTFESVGLKNLKALFLNGNAIENINADELLTNIPELERILLSGKKITEDKKIVLNKKFGDKNVKVIYVDNK